MDRSVSPWMRQLQDEAILTSIHGNVYPSITDPEWWKLEIEGWDAAIQVHKSIESNPWFTIPHDDD